MLTLLLFNASAAELCATPEAIQAAQGLRLPSHPGMIAAPEGVGHPPTTPPPPGAKTVYGSPYANHLETENFTINWWTSGVSRDTAERAGEALEGAWAAFLDEQGWTPPISADLYYIWVLLDPSLGGTTGYTAEYYSKEYPDGYPIIWLNPDWDYDDAFWAALAAHEFMHTLQFALREWDGASETETWYWEASATWSCQLADPDINGHEYTSAWYAEQPSLRYDATAGSHQYGIFVFNAWLEEKRTGPGGMKAVWELSADRYNVPWDEILAESTETSAGELWAGFTGAYGNGQLEESALYTAVSTVGTLEDGAHGTLKYLGTDYYVVAEDSVVTVTGSAVLGGADGTGASVEVHAGERLAVTGLEDGAAYALSVGPIVEDSGDSGTPDDTAPDDTAPDDTADTGPDEDSAPADADTGAPDKGGGCGCSGAPGRAGWLSPLPLLLGLLRRRAGVPEGRGARPATHP